MKPSLKMATALILLLAPLTAFADGVSPILNFFHRETWLPASIVTLVIILVESGLLRWRLWQISFARALWVSIVINVASSAVGSILLLAFGRDSFFMWDTMSLVLPLFIITLATEIPLLHTLLKQIPITWKRAYALGFEVNLASYAVVFAMEIGLLFAWIAYAGHLDKRESTEWRNPRLLRQVTGVIYTTESKGPKHGLRMFDPRTQSWLSLTNCPPIEPSHWDVEGNTCAFVRWDTAESKDKHLVISRLPDFSVLQEIGIDSFMDHGPANTANWQGITSLAVSPDSRNVAILFSYGAVVAYKDSTSHYALGSRCRVIVIDVETGKEVAHASRWASGAGLCWLPDARTVLFSSFDNEKLYDVQKSEVRGNTGHGVLYTRDGKFAQGLYAFTLDTGAISRFSDGRNPSLAFHEGLVLVRDDPMLRILDSSGREVSRIELPRLGYRGAIISPDGALLLAEIERHSPFFAGGTPTLVDMKTPTARHVLTLDYCYRYDWMEE